MLAECDSPQIRTKQDPITGDVGPAIRFASNHREYSEQTALLVGACGVNARFFEAKPPSP